MVLKIKSKIVASSLLDALEQLDLMNKFENRFDTSYDEWMEKPEIADTKVLEILLDEKPGEFLVDYNSCDSSFIIYEIENGEKKTIGTIKKEVQRLRIISIDLKCMYPDKYYYTEVVTNCGVITTSATESKSEAESDFISIKKLLY